MANITDALKNLYVAFGGDADDVATFSNITDVLNAIATHISEGGVAELPAVTTADNGKVLTVVAGKWDKANLPE